MDLFLYSGTQAFLLCVTESVISSETKHSSTVSQGLTETGNNLVEDRHDLHGDKNSEHHAQRRFNSIRIGSFHDA